MGLCEAIGDRCTVRAQSSHDSEAAVISDKSINPCSVLLLTPTQLVGIYCSTLVVVEASKHVFTMLLCLCVCVNVCMCVLGHSRDTRNGLNGSCGRTNVLCVYCVYFEELARIDL